VAVYDAARVSRAREFATEFGGAGGALAAMVLLPAVVYYLWICVEFYGGALQFPRTALLAHLAHAVPTWKATIVYLVWLAWQALLAWIGPGPSGQGALLPDGHSRLTYRYNGLFAWYLTLVAATALHVTGVFPLSTLYAEFGPLVTVATIVATALAALCYVGGRLSGRTNRASGNPIYDFFMGSVLNPRIGSFDIKFFVELRPGIMLWFLLSAAMLAQQRAAYGLVTTSMLLVVFYHACYANACFKGEECVPMSMDIAYENFGWMLSFGNLVWVPFVYCLQAYYVLTITPADIPRGFALPMLVLHMVGYWVFDTANSQKDYFRNEGRALRDAFPRLPWGRLRHPETLSTARGTPLLVSGWWGQARHMNYTGDLLMAWTWGLTCGFGSVIPYVYAVFLTLLLLHRLRRDERECRLKYGTDWDAYCRRVPYRLVPGVY